LIYVKGGCANCLSSTLQHKNFLSMLKEHLLSRIQQQLEIGPDVLDAPSLKVQTHPIFFKGERMYSHKIVRFNYTTYDVRRTQDIVNPGTSLCNVMLLSGRRPVSFTSEKSSAEFSDPQPHPYLYARVLGIYHANVIYTGHGMVDYTPKRMDFLWVRWYDHQAGENPYCLDRLSFPPINSKGAFGFVDPADVLRGCHIMPRFTKGKRHPSGIGFSKLARDSCDWIAYNVGR
jgi:hypothetical protein